MKAKRMRFNLAMPQAMALRLKEVAKQNYKSVNSLIQSYIKLGLMFSEGKIVIYSVNEDGSHSQTMIVL